MNGVLKGMVVMLSVIVIALVIKSKPIGEDLRPPCNGTWIKGETEPVQYELDFKVYIFDREILYCLDGEYLDAE